MQKAGGDNLEPSDAVVKKALNACLDVKQWVGGLYAVPGALGYKSAGQITDDDITTDLLTLCSANSRTATCKDAARRGLLD